MVASKSQEKRDRVKKPLNAYFVWSREFRKKLLEQNPKITIPNANILLGKIWSEMSVEEKKPYFKEAQKIKKQHEIDYPDFQGKSKPRIKNPNLKKYETVMISSELKNIVNNQYYKIPQTMAIPSGQMFWPIAKYNVPGSRGTFCTSVEPSNNMPLCVPQAYMDAKSCAQEPMERDDDAITLSPIVSQTECQSEALRNIPEENGAHFHNEYSALECNINDSSRSENSHTLRLSQERNETIEQIHEEDQPHIFSDVGTISCFSLTKDFSLPKIGQKESMDMENMSELPCFHMSDDDPLIDSFIATCEFCVKIQTLISEFA